jgi:hypothetical protein
VLKEAPVSSPLPMRRQAPPPPQEPKKSDAFVRKSIKYLIPHQTLHQLKDGLRGFLQVSPFKLASGEVLTTQENHSSYFDNRCARCPGTVLVCLLKCRVSLLKKYVLCKNNLDRCCKYLDCACG